MTMLTKALSTASLANPRSTSNVYVTPATVGGATICDSDGFLGRTSIGSAFVALIIGSLFNLLEGSVPISYWPETPGPNVEDAVQPITLSSANAQPGPQI